MKSEVADFAEHIFGVIPVAVKLKDVAIVGQKLLQGIDAFVRSKLRVRNYQPSFWVYETPCSQKFLKICCQVKSFILMYNLSTFENDQNLTF